MRILLNVLPLFLCSILSSCSGLSYIAENGIGQWKMFNRARPVDEVLANPNTKPEVVSAIHTVTRAKEFAVKKLGLSATKNYSSYVQLDGPCLVWAVSAAHPLQLEEKKWRFPLVGEVPYLGFFLKESAEKEAQRLLREEENPDVWVRCVPAFSSLGWFSDPLYSSMLKGKERDIAELVIHESLHATIWVGDSVDFNEKLANFVGLEGSLLYINAREGNTAFMAAQKEIIGEKLFGDFLHLVTEEYKKEVTTLKQKTVFYEQLANRYQRFLESKRKAGISFTALPVNFDGWNNAALLTFVNYYSDFSVFEEMLAKCDGSVERFVRWIALEKEKGRSFLNAPEEQLRKVKESNCVL